MSVNSIDVASNAVEASHYITQGTTNGNNEVDRITSLVIGPGETVVVKSVTAEPALGSVIPKPITISPFNNFFKYIIPIPDPVSDILIID